MTFGGKVCLFKLQKGSKNDLLSKIWIFFENRQKIVFFKNSEKNLVTSKMEQNPSSCSIGIWNYHLAKTNFKSRIFPHPYASPLWNQCIDVEVWIVGGDRTETRCPQQWEMLWKFSCFLIGLIVTGILPLRLSPLYNRNTRPHLHTYYVLWSRKLTFSLCWIS